MGYTTDFSGQIDIMPPLNEQEREFLTKFNRTRRMASAKGPYYVDRAGDFGQDKTSDVTNYNQPPSGQPGLWCQWVPTDDGSAIEWDGAEKFYNAPKWMKYLIEHFVGSNPIAKSSLPFLTGHTLNGEVEAQGEDPDDRWKLIVQDNKVSVAQAVISYGDYQSV